jgi:PAS domain-containing protein
LSRNDRGDYAGIIATLKDITEKKAAEKAINVKNRQINSLLETTSDVIYIKDAEGRNILINRAYAEKFNIEQEHVYGKTDYEILPAEWLIQCSKSG